MTSEEPFCVQVFSRCPQHGRPKTRLQPPLTQAQASRLHWQLTTHTVNTAVASGAIVQLWLDRPSEHPWVAALQHESGCELRVQSEGNIGARMLHALKIGLQHHTQLILIGSDCAVLKVAHLNDLNARLLGNSRVALIPAEDGGYVAIGATQVDSRLFAGIEWGGDRVVVQTRARLSAIGWQWAELAPLWDVDRPADLERLRVEGIELPPVLGM